MQQYNEQPNISIMTRLMFILITCLPFMIKCISVVLNLENEDPQLASALQKISVFIIGLIIVLIIFKLSVEFLYPNDDNENVTVKNEINLTPISNSPAIENNKKSNSSILINLSTKTIYRPNVDKILSMIQYIEDLQKQIKNSLNVNQIASPSQLQLSDIDQSIFIKFNILQEKFMLDYQAIDWNNNINQEISNSYQKIYNKHQNLIQEEYNNIKSYLKDYLDHKTIKSEEILDLIKKIIN